MQKTIQGLAEEIAGSLIQELGSRATDGTPPADGAAEEPAGQAAEEAAQRLPALSTAGGAAAPGFQDRLSALETRLEKLAFLDQSTPKDFGKLVAPTSV